MDIMIEKGTFQPKLLEMTFSPDCGRACKYTKTFMNDIISSLFLHKPNEECNMDQIWVLTSYDIVIYFRFNLAKFIN